ncbi:MAG: hypothetical protein B6242_15545 [Anaerolineaceae bacterium 4572_78]|nr:MAG: hypothetical protein B6242_15545 [Anaerolineaceae bacterium 4572_78]
MEIYKHDRIFINSMPKSGTHLLSKSIELLGFHNFSSRKTIFQKIIWHLRLGHPKEFGYEAVNQNWYRYFKSQILSNSHDTIPLDVTSPILVPIDIVSRWLNSVPQKSCILGHVPWSQNMDDLLKKHGYKHIIIVRDPRDVFISFVKFVSKPPHSLSKDFQSLSQEQQMNTTFYGGYMPISKRNNVGLSKAFQSILAWQNSSNCLIVKFEDLVGIKGGGTQLK